MQNQKCCEHRDDGDSRPHWRSAFPATPPDAQLASRTMAPTPSPAKLREAIAETLWGEVSAHDLPHLCGALGMPKAPSDVRAMDSKRRYVRQRLIGLCAPSSPTWPERLRSSTKFRLIPGIGAGGTLTAPDGANGAD